MLYSIDISPQFQPSDVFNKFPQWKHVQDFGVNAISKIDRCDLVILHEDANWFTTYQSLVAILDHWCAGDLYRLPVILIHNTSEPYGRRDHYRNKEYIPAQYTQATGGSNAALYEGNTHNGVLKGLEDFCQQYDPQNALHVSHIFASGGLSIIASAAARPSVLSLIHLFQQSDFAHIVEDMSSVLTEHNAMLKKHSDYEAVIDALVHEHHQHKDNSEKKLLLLKTDTHSLQRQVAILNSEKVSVESKIEFLQQKYEELQKATENLSRENEEMRREISTKEQEIDRMQYALKASNHSRMQQGQLLSAELETVQRLLAKKHKEWEHMHHTLSWRVTAPLRQLGRIMRSLTSKSIIDRCMYAVFGALKDLWEDFGKPFPRLVHAIRYGVFRKWKPKSQESIVQNPPLQKAPISTPLSSTTPLTTVAIVHGEHTNTLMQTLQSAITQSLPFAHIVVLYKTPLLHRESLQAQFPSVQFYQISQDIDTEVHSIAMQYPTPYICYIPSGRTLTTDALRIASAMLNRETSTEAIYWHPQSGTLMRGSKRTIVDAPMIMRSTIPYIPTAGAEHSASYPSVPIHVSNTTE